MDLYWHSGNITRYLRDLYGSSRKALWERGSNLSGKLVLTAGIGGMGGAQPLAVKMSGGVFLGCDVCLERINKRIKTRYLDEYYESFEEAVSRALKAKEKGEAIFIAVKANAADFFKYIYDKDITPDLVTDQTSAHDPLTDMFHTHLMKPQLRN